MFQEAHQCMEQNYQLIVYMLVHSVNMFKNRIDKYLVKAGYT